MRIKIFLTLAILVVSSNSFAAWSGFTEVGQLQSYGNGMQVWLKGIGCPNAKPYFSIKENYTAKFDTIVSMVLMAKASKTKIKFQYNTTDNPTFCYVTGIQIE